MSDHDFDDLNPPLARDEGGGCCGCFVWILAIIGFISVLKWIF